jgi:hypothetical protein
LARGRPARPRRDILTPSSQPAAAHSHAHPTSDRRWCIIKRTRQSHAAVPPHIRPCRRQPPLRLPLLRPTVTRTSSHLSTVLLSPLLFCTPLVSISVVFDVPAKKAASADSLPGSYDLILQLRTVDGVTKLWVAVRGGRGSGGDESVDIARVRPGAGWCGVVHVCASCGCDVVGMGKQGRQAIDGAGGAAERWEEGGGCG